MRISKYGHSHMANDGQQTILCGALMSQGEIRFPPPEFLIGDETATPVPLSPIGQLYTYTTVHPGKAPAYSLAMVDFDHGLRIFGRLLLGEAPPALGSNVRVVPFTLSEGEIDFAFEPVEEDAA
ncbi:hypothetical protein DM806_09795 [Sphingobium lactosutens]|nr:hypothetical protein [Sphingobium lactosutens]